MGEKWEEERSGRSKPQKPWGFATPAACYPRSGGPVIDDASEGQSTRFPNLEPQANGVAPAAATRLFPEPLQLNALRAKNPW